MYILKRSETRRTDHRSWGSHWRQAEWTDGRSQGPSAGAGCGLHRWDGPLRPWTHSWEGGACQRGRWVEKHQPTWDQSTSQSETKAPANQQIKHCMKPRGWPMYDGRKPSLLRVGPEQRTTCRPVLGPLSGWLVHTQRYYGYSMLTSNLYHHRQHTALSRGKD